MIARQNVERYFGGPHPRWQLVTGELPADDAFDRVVLEMLAPWEYANAAAMSLRAGGLICCYVATTRLKPQGTGAK